MALALLFAGQGAQKVGMGKSLYAGSAAARALYDQANTVLGWDLAKSQFRGSEIDLTRRPKSGNPPFSSMGCTTFGRAQKARKASRRSLTRHGLTSLGEVTALTAAGVFDVSTGLRVVAERGRLMQDACLDTVGGMAAVFFIGQERSKVAELCAEFDIEAANFNAPGQIIVSGEKAKVDLAVAAAKERGLKAVIIVIPLNVAGAYHSRLMEPARRAFDLYLERAFRLLGRSSPCIQTRLGSVPSASRPKSRTRWSNRLSPPCCGKTACARPWRAGSPLIS